MAHVPKASMLLLLQRRWRWPTMAHVPKASMLLLLRRRRQRRLACRPVASGAHPEAPPLVSTTE